MNAIELANRDEIDRDILTFVRDMQKLAPVSAESVASFLRVQRRRALSDRAVRDRLDYLESAGYLQAPREWHAGAETREYRITATGMDLLDGAIPPRGWRPR